jgi:diguanylate cyclase (GGDEF)-like protein
VDELHHNASHDGLTGLLNLVGFRGHIDRVLKSVSAVHEHVGLLFIDLNDFKLVNDTFGHEGGDELLRQAASRLRGIGRDDDRVARLGGDEFAIILADAAMYEDKAEHRRTSRERGRELAPQHA